MKKRPIPVDTILNEVSSVATGELRNLSQSGNFKQSAAMAYALSSELNVKVSVYFNIWTGEMWKISAWTFSVIWHKF